MKTVSVIAAGLLSAAFVVAQGGDVVPNENLVAEGIPKIPAAIAEAVRPYSESRSAGFASWHPTRREMLIATRFADTAQVHLVKMPGGARRQMTFFPDRSRGPPFTRREETSSCSRRTSEAVSSSSSTGTTCRRGPSRS